MAFTLNLAASATIASCVSLLDSLSVSRFARLISGAQHALHKLRFAPGHNSDNLGTLETDSKLSSECVRGQRVLCPLTAE